MEDPRETFWRQRCDDHSHMNAVHVAFAAAYAEAIPNARRAQRYLAKFPSLLQQARRYELESAIPVVEEDGGNIIEEQTTYTQDHITQDAIPENVIVGQHIPERKLQSNTVEVSASRKRRRQPQMVDSGGSLVNDERDTSGRESHLVSTASGGSSSTELPQTTKATTRPRIRGKEPSQRAASTNSTKRTSSRASISALPQPTNPTTGSSKLPKPLKVVAKSHKKAGSGDDKEREAGYSILPHCPGTTEVIFDRYPLLHTLANTKRGKQRVFIGSNKDVRKMPDMSRLIFLCRKASSTVGQNRAMKAGRDNIAVGGNGQLVFLRRNAARLKSRMGTQRV